MLTAIIKEELHKHIENGDDKLLKMIYAVVREYNDIPISEKAVSEFEKRTEKRKNGNSKTYEWHAAKKIITGKKGSN